MRNSKIQKIIFSTLIAVMLSSCTKIVITEEDRYRIEAEKGDVDSQMKLANLYYLNVFLYPKNAKENHEMAVKWYEEAAKNGSELAMFKLGEIYDLSYSGKDAEYIKKDMKKSISMYEKAALKGNIEAKNRLGYAYNSSYDPITREELTCESKIFQKKEAINYYSKAYNYYAKSEVAFELAEIFKNGESGCVINMEQALKYYNQVDLDSRYKAAALKAEGKYAYDQKNYGLALDKYIYFLDHFANARYYNKDELQDIMEIEFKVGYIFENIKGHINPAKAILYYTRSANRGLIEAQHNLAILKGKIGSFKP